ncbi:MAG: glycoside hydrolase family 20 zincin-like fold domain-containing protein [Planctomycetota bacterium]|jgi:hypothetical protein
MKLHLIPEPKKVSLSKKIYILADDSEIIIPDSSVLNGAIQLADEIEAAFNPRPAIRKGASLSESTIKLVLKKGKAVKGSYSLVINNSGVLIEAGDSAGLFYGIQTLRQVVRQCGINLPCCTITDSPDFPARGFYHDITRGMIPTFDELCAMADRLAHYKVNQLQLYVEHTFAFAKHIDIWGGNDPLTAEEIIRLDDYCKKLHIELVPSLTTFGHFYMGLRSKRKEHLNEYDMKAGDLPYSFNDRMAHYTLDCSNPESLKVVTDMVKEYAALFSSKIFNICCDETFDLGKGRNKEKADNLPAGKLYIDFLLKIMKAVRKEGKTPMYWGDIVLHHLAPELRKALPKDAIALNWDYSPNLTFGDSKPFADRKIPFYVCPGTTSWNRFLADVEIASSNITKLAAQGKKYGAIGLLNTNWGDWGHVNLLGTVLHGMLLGAGVSWNVKSGKNLKGFDDAFNFLELGDLSNKTAGLLRKAARASATNWRLVAELVDKSESFSAGKQATKSGMPMVRLKGASPARLLKSYSTLVEVREELKKAGQKSLCKDPLVYKELVLGAKGSALMHLIMLACQKKEGMKVGKLPYSNNRLADEIRIFEQQLKNIWHKRNRPSEYYRLCTALLDIARVVEGL